MPRQPLGSSHWRQIAGLGERHLDPVLRRHLICPDDDAPIGQDPRDEARFICTGCSRIFHLENGILQVLPINEPYAATVEEHSAREAAPFSPAEPGSPLWSHVEAAAGDVTGKTVLDACCGTAWAAEWFARRGAHVAATDIHAGPNSLAGAQERRDAATVSFDLFQADPSRLPFAPETFDVVFTSGAFYQMRRPERLALEVARVLRSGGVAICVGEPIGRGALAPAMGANDPRAEGRSLAVGDYMALFREANLATEVLGGSGNPQKERGLFGSLRRRAREAHDVSPRVFVLHHIPGFHLPVFGRRAKQ